MGMISQEEGMRHEGLRDDLEKALDVAILLNLTFVQTLLDRYCPIDVASCCFRVWSGWGIEVMGGLVRK